MSLTKNRSFNTLRTIFMQYQHEGKQPYLTAISTIYQNLLVKPAPDDVWQLFHKVASLPLRTTRFEVKCVAHDDPCERQIKNGHCWHGLVEVPHSVELCPSDHYLFDKGRCVDAQTLASWWGKQLEGALTAVAT